MFCLSSDLFGEIELLEFDIWLKLAFSLLRDVSDPFFLLRRSATDPPTASLIKQNMCSSKDLASYSPSLPRVDFELYPHL